MCPGVATATIRPSSLSARLLAKTPNGPPSSAIGVGAKPGGNGWRSTRRITRWEGGAQELELGVVDRDGDAHVDEAVDVIAVVVGQHDLVDVVEQELPGAIAAAGLSLEDVAEVVLTHHHGDHVDGATCARPCSIHEAELQFLRTPFPARDAPRAAPAPAARLRSEPFVLDGGPFGAFAASRALSDDGRIVAVATPGHTPGHISVICVDDDGRHVMLAGDATDTLEQLHARRADAVGPEPEVHVATLDTILAHAPHHPTVFLPSHDPESAARLAGGTTVS